MSVPARRPCSFCPQPYVELRQSLVTGEETRRCIDHPPPDAVPGSCPTCGRLFWPDLLHLDCPTPESENR